MRVMARIAKPSQRDSRISQTRFETLTPELLSHVLNELAIGNLTDWSDLCDRMVTRDTQIASAYETRLSVISASDLLVEENEHATDRAMARLAKVVIEMALDRIPSRQERVYESLDGVGRGASAHEIEWEEVDGMMLPKALHHVPLRRLAYDTNVWKLCLADAGGDKAYQFPGKPLEDYTDRFLIHEPRPIPGYPTGGIMRPVAWSFMFKAWCVSFWLQGAESFAWPAKIGRVSRNADDAVREAMRAALEELTVNHSAIIEGELGNASIEFLESTVKDGGTWRDLVSVINADISTAILGMTDLSSPTRVGAYAAVETRKGATIDARIAKDERALSSSWKRGLFEPILRRNLHLFDGVMPPVPSPRWAIPSTEKVIPPQAFPYVTVDEIRASMGMPPLPNGAGQVLASAQAPAVTSSAVPAP